MLGVALAVEVTPVEIKEIVYQAVPYVVWPGSSTSSTRPTRYSPSGVALPPTPATPRKRIEGF